MFFLILLSREEKNLWCIFLFCRFSISYAFLSHSVFVYSAIITQLKRRRRKKKDRRHKRKGKSQQVIMEEFQTLVCTLMFVWACVYVWVCVYLISLFNISKRDRDEFHYFLCLTIRNKMAFEKVRLNLRLISFQSDFLMLICFLGQMKRKEKIVSKMN